MHYEWPKNSVLRRDEKSTQCIWRACFIKTLVWTYCWSKKQSPSSSELAFGFCIKTILVHNTTNQQTKNRNNWIHKTSQSLPISIIVIWSSPRANKTIKFSLLSTANTSCTIVACIISYALFITQRFRAFPPLQFCFRLANIEQFDFRESHYKRTNSPTWCVCLDGGFFECVIRMFVCTFVHCVIYSTVHVIWFCCVL